MYIITLQDLFWVVSIFWIVYQVWERYNDKKQ